MSLPEVLGKIFNFLAATALGILMLLAVAGVFQRYIMSAPISWLEEVNGILFLWAIMLGCAAAKREGSHLSIDIITARLPKKAQYIMVIVSEVVTIAVMSIMCWYGILLATQVQFKITNILGISYAYIDYAIPAGAFGIALFSCANIVSLVRNSSSFQKKEYTQ